MQFIVVTSRRTDTFPPDTWTAELLEQESQRVRELYADGCLRSIWRRKDKPGAVLLFEAATEEEAKEKASSLPLAQKGMLEFVLLTQLDPYPGFGPR